MGAHAPVGGARRPPADGGRAGGVRHDRRRPRPDRPGPGPRLRRLGDERRRDGPPSPPASGPARVRRRRRDRPDAGRHVARRPHAGGRAPRLVPAGDPRHPLHHDRRCHARPTSTARTTHAAGSFGRHVRSLVLARPDGSTVTLTPEATPEAFWATCGGMGLTGTVVEATVALYPIPSSRLAVDTDRCPTSTRCWELLGENTPPLLGGLDRLLATGRHLGRSVLTRATSPPWRCRPPGAATLHYDRWSPCRRRRCRRGR